MEYIKLYKNKQMFVGAMYLFEGEVMKIIVKEPEIFQVGEEVECCLTDIRFNSRILKKEGNHIYIHVPHINEKDPFDKRAFPRIDVGLNGIIIVNQNEQHLYNEVNVIDLSHVGIGFMSKQRLKNNHIYPLHIESTELSIKLEIEIRNINELNEHIRYGSEIIHISKEDQFSLRKFVMIKQLITNMDIDE